MKDKIGMFSLGSNVKEIDSSFSQKLYKFLDPM